MLKVAFFALFIALLMVMFQLYSPDIAKLHQLQQTNKDLTEQVELLQSQLVLSQLEQQRLKEALAKHDAAKMNRLYE